MSEEPAATMEDLPAAELEPGEPVEAASSENSNNVEENAVAPEPAASARESDADTVGAVADAAAETQAAGMSATSPVEDSNAADTPVDEQQQSTCGTTPGSDTFADTEAEAAVATAEEGAEQQPEHAADANAEHAAHAAPDGTAAVAVDGAVDVAEAAAAADKQQAAQPEQQTRQPTHSQASRPASSIQTADSTKPSAAAEVSKPKPASAAAEVPKPAPAAVSEAAKQHAEEGVEQAAPEMHMASSKPHKETAAERLTTPTAMRMLKTLQQTQGDKAEWHIASGVVYKSKKLAPDEMAAMVDRLCVAKHQDDDMPAKLHAVKLVYDDNGKEVYEPVKEVTKQENISYMAELYSRCQETRAKTQQHLTEKYLQPLVKPKAPSASKAGKAPAAETT